MFKKSQHDLLKLSKIQLLSLLQKKEKELAQAKAENMALKINIASMSNNELEIFSLQKILELMPGNVFWKTKEGIYLGCNNNVANFFGFNSPDEIIGKHNRDFIPAEYAETLDKIDQEVIASKKGRYAEETGVNLNNEPAIFFTQKIPLCNKNGDVVGLLGIAMDITKRKKIEKELEIAKEAAETSNHAKSQFLAVINHELRTPLTGILGLINFLKQNKLSREEEINIVKDLENCSHYLLSLVNDVLDFARIESGETIVRIQPVTVEELINEILSILAGLAKNKDLSLHKHIDPNVPKMILTDSRILHQILINIVNNAIKFTTQGHISIDVKCSHHQAQKAQLSIAITDTGPGIPANKFDVIFEPFQQLENAYNRQSSRSGTGLGLSIVKKLAELIDVKVEVESKLGQGSTFTLSGEFEVVEDFVNVPSLSPKLDAELIAKKLKVLLVEDDYIVQLVHKKMLEDLGCHVEVAINGQNALSMFSHHDILFVDIGLPDISGFNVIKTIRHKHNNLTPIIALTGYTGEREHQACLTAGANDVASKPISLNHLKNLLLRYTD